MPKGTLLEKKKKATPVNSAKTKRKPQESAKTKAKAPAKKEPVKKKVVKKSNAKPDKPEKTEKADRTEKGAKTDKGSEHEEEEEDQERTKKMDKTERGDKQSVRGDKKKKVESKESIRGDGGTGGSLRSKKIGTGGLSARLKRKLAPKTDGDATEKSTCSGLRTRGGNPAQKLENQEWYFGVWPREQASRRLKKDGNFLCRLTADEAGADALVVSVMAEGQVVHCPVNVVGGRGGNRRYAFDGRAHDSVYALIADTIVEKASISRNANVTLGKGVRRPEFCLRHKDVEERELVGPAAYGGSSEVFLGRFAKGSGPKDSKLLSVVLKKSSPDAGDEERSMMVDEAKALHHLHNPEPSKLVLALHGLCSDKLPMLLILEDWGKPLPAFLKANKTLPPGRRMGLSKELGRILEFLEEKNTVHRNLRSSALWTDGSRVKLGELSWAVEGPTWRDGAKTEPPFFPPGGARWAAPELMDSGQFSVQSDLWAMAVVVWEVCSGGERPWGPATDAEIQAKVTGGQKLSLPDGAPPELSDLLGRAWEPIAMSRPTPREFSQALQHLSLPAASNNDDNYQPMPDVN